MYVLTKDTCGKLINLIAFYSLFCLSNKKVTHLKCMRKSNYLLISGFSYVRLLSSLPGNNIVTFYIIIPYITNQNFVREISIMMYDEDKKSSSTDTSVD